MACGIGEVAGILVRESVEELSHHGNYADTAVTWWDGKIAEAIPATFGGELRTDLALAMISIHSTVQAARRWARAECCGSCFAAALKHRFVVLHHAVRSIQQLYLRLESLGPVAAEHVRALAESEDLQAVVAQPFRRLRNGWLHLGLGDIASSLPNDVNILSPVSAYTELQIPAFTELVDRTLTQVSNGIGEWLAVPNVEGASLFDYLHSPPD